MYATYIRTVAPDAENGHTLSDRSRIDSFNLTREQALANARWAMVNAHSIVVDAPEGEHKWIRTRGTWTFNKYPNI